MLTTHIKPCNRRREAMVRKVSVAAIRSRIFSSEVDIDKVCFLQYRSVCLHSTFTPFELCKC